MEVTGSGSGDRRLAAAGAAAEPSVPWQGPGANVPARGPAMLPLGEVLSLRDAGAAILDGRGAAEFAAGHLRGAVSIGLRGHFEECASAVLPLDRDLVLVGDSDLAAEATARLGAAGYDRVTGQLDDLASVLAG